MMKAKFRVDSVTQFEGCEKLDMSAVGCSSAYPESGEDEDNTYALWTPTASLSMTITNPALHGKFKPGQKFYLDFTLAE